MVCAGPCRSKTLADPVGQDRQRVAGHEVAVGAGGVGQPQVAVVGGGGADEDADLPLPASREAGQPASSSASRGDLQQQALLRVHLRRLARGDAEGGGVEAGDVAQGAGGEAVGSAGLAAARMDEGGLAEAVGRAGW